MVRSAKGSVGAVCRAPMHAALLWQAFPETPGRLAGCPPSGSFKPRKNQASSPMRAACQPPKKLAGWLAGCPLGPEAQRPGDAHQPPKGATGPTRPQQSPLDCRWQRASPTRLGGKGRRGRPCHWARGGYTSCIVTSRFAREFFWECKS